MPNLCVVPTAISNPIYPGDLNRQEANKSVATSEPILYFLAKEVMDVRSLNSPLLHGFWVTTPAKDFSY